MKKILLLPMAAALLLSAQDTIEQKTELYSLKNIQLGQDYLVIKNLYKLYGEKTSGPVDLYSIGESFLDGTFTIAGVKAKLVNLVFYSKTQKLGLIIVMFDSNNFESILASFIEKYGKPSSQSQKEVSNVMGAKFSNKTAMWRNSLSSIIIEERGSNINTGSVQYTHTAINEDILKETSDKAKKNSNDL